MKKIKLHWPQRLRLPRKWRVARNFLVAAALLLAGMIALEWPTPTLRGAYRRLEKQLLLSPSEVVYTHKTNNEAVFLTQGEGWITAGSVTKVQIAGSPFVDNMACIQYIMPEEELAVIPMPLETGNDELVIAVHGFPPRTHSAQIELDLFGMEPIWFNESQRPGDETMTAEAETQENGWLFFTIKPHESGAHGDKPCALDVLWANIIAIWKGVECYPYRLHFTDANGEWIDTVSGSLPETELIMS